MMMVKRIAIALLLLVLLAAGVYFYPFTNDASSINALDLGEKQAAINESELEQSEATSDNVPGITSVVTEEMRAELDKLVSLDPDVKRKALAELALEFSSDTPPSERKYSNYGDALLPVLTQIIGNVDDRHARNAVKAVYYMTQVDQWSQDEKLLASSEGFKDELEKLAHYPNPRNYAPMKGALVSALQGNRNNDARLWAAMSLGNGFEPAREIEEVFAARFPIEENHRNVQLAILGGLKKMADRSALMRSTELSIIGGLASTNQRTRQAVAEVIAIHPFDGGLEGLVENIPTTTDVNTLKRMLGAILSYGKTSEASIIELERIASETNEDDRKNEILLTVETLRNLGTR